jgi:hypothetical protein
MTEASQLYEPLLKSSRQLRLLTLYPYSYPGEAIRCDLIKASLDSDPRYEALSYTWGEPINEATITVNAITLPVRRNLWDALCHLRGAEARTLWIDAVCINQNNIPERNSQVQMMRHIYEKAQRVVIWLGVERDESNLAFKFMAFISDDRRKRARTGKKLDGLAKYSGYEEELEAVQKLCQRPYWERLWIIQEVVVSQEAELYCGLDHMSWDDFSRFQKCVEDGGIEMGGDDSIQNSLAFNLDRYRVYNQTDYSNLIELLEPFSLSLCYEVRDKIYGLVGLARDANNFKIDYSRSIYDIFVDVIQLQWKEDCALLVACSQFLQRLLQGDVAKSAPSNQPPTDPLVGALGFEVGIVKFVSAESSTFEPGIFQSMLTEDDSIEQVCKDWTHDVEALIELEKNRLVTERLHTVSGKLSYALKGGQTFKAYQRTRSSGLETRNGPNDRPVSTPTIFPWGQLKRLESPPDVNIDVTGNGKLRCFVDDRGYVGAATGGIRPLDTVCQFQASDVVAILRWQESSSCYALVGSAIFPKKRQEENTPFLKDPKDSFQFSVPLSAQCTKPISLWLSPCDLQKLTD